MVLCGDNFQLLAETNRNSPAVQWLGLCAFIDKSSSLRPSKGTKIV